jgi:hypothetical protein
MTLDKQDRGILLLALGMATEYESRALQRCHSGPGEDMRGLTSSLKIDVQLEVALSTFI